MDPQHQRLERADVNHVEQRKVARVAEFLEESFVGCSVDVREDRERAAHLYLIVDDTSGQLRHRVLVSRAFFRAHDESDILPALQALALVTCLRLAGGRRIIVTSRSIEFEPEDSR